MLRSGLRSETIEQTGNLVQRFRMSDRQKFISLNEPLYDYVCSQRSGAGDPLLNELRRITNELGEHARMQISPEQGSFLQILTTAVGANNALEIGTFTGYSSLCIARGLPDKGKLTCLDVSDEWTTIAKLFWERAEVHQKIELIIGPALESLPSLQPNELLDLVFIDALKVEYSQYFELVLPLVRKNGLILFDNMLWGGSVVDASKDESADALDRLNRMLAKDPRVECVLLPVSDGIQLCRVR